MDPNTRHNRREALNTSLLYAFLGGLLLVLEACAPSARYVRESGASDALAVPLEPVSARIIYIIHGDADYTWHDSTGARHFADREALAQAVEVARRDSSAEVFIFHQKPVSTGFLSPDFDGTFYYYRTGRLRYKTAYNRTGVDFEAEAKLLTQEAWLRPHDLKDSIPPRQFLAYFGHEIPLSTTNGYTASHPEFRFSTGDFVRGLGRFGERPFDLAIVSACYGGNPTLMRGLVPHARYVIASPAYLHLSFLDTRSLGDISDTSTGTIPALADTIARRSFDHLRQNTQTEITVGVYDLGKASSYLESSRTHKEGLKTPSRAPMVWKDCAEAPAFDSTGAARGVKLYYQPPRFGPQKNKATRSAWQCMF